VFASKEGRLNFFKLFFHSSSSLCCLEQIQWLFFLFNKLKVSSSSCYAVVLWIITTIAWRNMWHGRCVCVSFCFKSSFLWQFLPARINWILHVAFPFIIYDTFQHIPHLFVSIIIIIIHDDISQSHISH
jgi:hypothetical protein